MSDSKKEILEQYKVQVNTILSELAPIWMPHDGQMPILKDLLFNFAIGIFVQCGRKFGKTELAIFCCYVIAIMIPGAEVYYIADEKDHARDICWTNGRLPHFFTTFSRKEDETEESYLVRVKYGHKLAKKYVLGIDNQSMVVKLTNGSTIKVDGAKNYSRADGLSPAFVVYDEFKHHDPRYDQAMRPNLKAKNGRLLIIGTPPENEQNYYYETSQEFLNRARHKFYKSPCYMNPYVYKGVDDPKLAEDKKIAEMKGELHIFLREYMAEITPDQSRTIFPMFDKKKHVVPYNILLDHINANRKEWSYHLHFDPGTTSTSASLIVCINRYDKRIFVMDEVYETNMMDTIVKKVYPKALSKALAIRNEKDYWRKGYDIAAAWFAAEVANEYGDGLTPCDKHMRDKEAVLSIIKEAMLFDRFYISDRCPFTIKEILGYIKDDNGNIPKEFDHNIDNLRYILNSEGYNFVPRDHLPPPIEKRYFTFADDLEQNNTDEENEAFDPFKEIVDHYEYEGEIYD